MEHYDKPFNVIDNDNKISLGQNPNPLFLKIFEDTSDYEQVELSNLEYNKIVNDTINIYDLEDIELTINNYLLRIGYTYNEKLYKWQKI